MVKEQDKNSAKRQEKQGKAECAASASKIGHSTPYGCCSERLSAFGGLLGLIKLRDCINHRHAHRTWVIMIWYMVL